MCHLCVGGPEKQQVKQSNAQLLSTMKYIYSWRQINDRFSSKYNLCIDEAKGKKAENGFRLGGRHNFS